jgi:hypothetical protein
MCAGFEEWLGGGSTSDSAGEEIIKMMNHEFII